GEAGGLVTQALDEIEHGIARLEQQRLVAAWEMEMLAAGIAVGPLGDADERDVGDAEGLQQLARDGELSAAAVDQHEVGSRGEIVASGLRGVGVRLRVGFEDG